MRKRIAAACFVFCSTAVTQQPAIAPCEVNARSQAELSDCAGAELKRADAELNRVYQQLLSKAGGNSAAAQKIRVAQRAWLAFRDAHIAELWPNAANLGSAHSMCVNQALGELTKERLKMLQHMLAAEEGDVCRPAYGGQ